MPGLIDEDKLYLDVETEINFRGLTRHGEERNRISATVINDHVYLEIFDSVCTEAGEIFLTKEQYNTLVNEINNLLK